MAPAAKEAPQRGLVHPDRPGYYFSSPKEYLTWYRQRNPESGNWPTVGVLLYRKHVISELPYIPQLVRHMESQQLTPLPLFISGVDGHIAVRDSLTSVFETEQVKRGQIKVNPTLSRDAVNVDAVVSTIGFPLVGGPAGSMEGARQAELASINRLPHTHTNTFCAWPLVRGATWCIEARHHVLRSCVVKRV
jgi:magnesium chelatase subunit H